MKISPHKHQQIRLKNGLITLALLCLLSTLAWLSSRYRTEIDITANAGNSLSQASQKLLESLPDEIHLTAYIKKNPALRSQIAQLVDRYKRRKANLSLTFIDPDAHPDKTRELNIDAAGAIIVDYQGRTEKLNFIDESSLTNALLQLANADERWVTFLSGHGERAPDGIANFDLGQFGKELERRKIKAQTLNLATLPDIPSNSALLVLSAPAVALLAEEIDLIKRYIRQGGNLLLLTDPGNRHLDALQQQLGLRQLPGTLVDSKSKLYGINDPSFVLASDYIAHPISQGFQSITVYPITSALEVSAETDFQAVALLKSAAQSWTETGPITGKIAFDADGDEKQGPLAFAYALTRPSTSSGQAPSTSSGQAPSTSSGQAPSTSSGQAPSTSSGQAPSTSSGQAPSTSPGQAPSTSPGQVPSSGSGQNKPVEQRIVVVGDGDFLSNSYIGNVGNLDMGLRMIDWLIHDDRFIDVPAKTAADKSLQLSPIGVALIGFGFLLVIPLLLLGAGFFIWRKRKQR